MWTGDALVSEARPWKGTAWRLVESQSVVSTMKLVDDLREQSVLEDIIEASKPPLPPECRHLPYLLATPFRYAPYDHGSRFRRAHQREGCFYASLTPETAVAEIAFYRLLFFHEAPGMTLPANALPHTAFSVRVNAARTIDLARAPFDRDSADWTSPIDYVPCQNLGDAARASGIEAIAYASVRDPRQGRNLAVLSPACLVPPPKDFRTWRLFVRRTAIQAYGDRAAPIEFRAEEWADDPRIASMLTASRTPGSQEFGPGKS